MNIEWNKVRWYSVLFAVILAIAIFCIGIYLGEQFSQVHPLVSH